MRGPSMASDKVIFSKNTFIAVQASAVGAAAPPVAAAIIFRSPDARSNTTIGARDCGPIPCCFGAVASTIPVSSAIRPMPNRL